MANQKSDFEVFQEMSQNDEDIHMTPHLVEAKTAKGGGHIVMGVTDAIVKDMFLNPDKYVCALYIVNKEQFFKRKEQKKTT
jgi:hypothetical protein